MNLDGAFVRHEFSCQRDEILHVRTKYDRPARHDRFDRILPAVRGHAFADKYDGRNTVPASKVTGRIEKHAIGFNLAVIRRFAR